MLCHEIMKSNVASAWIYDPISSVAARMRARNIGFMPVCDDPGEVVGTISDRELVVRAMADRLDYDVPAYGIMSAPAITCRHFEEHHDVVRTQ